jgi:hypothetical protein
VLLYLFGNVRFRRSVLAQGRRIPDDLISGCQVRGFDELLAGLIAFPKRKQRQTEIVMSLSRSRRTRDGLLKMPLRIGELFVLLSLCALSIVLGDCLGQ